MSWWKARDGDGKRVQFVERHVVASVGHDRNCDITGFELRLAAPEIHEETLA
jgi:hypothetical protein